MRRFRLFLLAITVTTLGVSLAPATAAAACPTGPDAIWMDSAAYGVYNTPVEHVLARPGTVLGVSNDVWADSYRSAGADTVGWHMQLPALVGKVKTPFTKSKVLSKVPSLAALANRMTTCDEPWLALNEMVTVQAHEPLNYAQRRYRENVLLLSKELHERGVRVIMLLPRIPNQKTRYKAYWRNLSRHADLVYEAYTFSSREVARKSDAAGRKFLRDRWTTAVKRLKPFAVDKRRVGLMIPYWSNHHLSGRVGLSDHAWFRLTKMKTLAAADIGRNQNLDTLWSWGWHTNPRVHEVDADKPRAACYYLQARDPALCDPSSL